ncbi:MAG: TonB-dependent receptor, partial [Tannerellaceae bacterium]
AIVDRKEQEKPILGFHFYDINAKVNHSFSERSRLFVNFYMGRDSYKGGSKLKDAGVQNLFHWSWGNLIGSANWNYVFNNKLFSNFTLGYSRYRSRIEQTENHYTFNQRQHYSHQQSLFRSNMEDVSFRADFDYRTHPKHHIRFGTDYLFHLFRPEHNSLHYWYKNSIVDKETHTVYANELLQGHELSLYVEDEMSPTDRLGVTIGLRHTLFKVEEVSYHSFQPRLSARYL